MGDQIDDTNGNPPEGQDDQLAGQDDQELEVDDLKPDDQEDLSPEERALHKLQSWQGRREKAFQEKLIDKVSEIITPVLEQVQQPPVVEQPPSGSQFAEPEPDPYENINAWADWRDRKKAFEATVRQSHDGQVYNATLTQIKHPDDDVHQAALKEMKHIQNIDPVTGLPMSPAADAMLNYNNALRSVYEKRLVAEPRKNPLEKNGIPEPGLGVSGAGGGAKPSPVVMPQNLDSSAQKMTSYLSTVGWNAEKIKKTLEGIKD